MSLIARDSGGGDFQPAPPGTHVARCYAMIDLGTQTSRYGEAVKVFLRWELVDEVMDNGEPFSIGKFYTLSLHEKATLRRDLEAWRGRAFTPEELTGFDLRKVLGAACLLNVTEKPREGGGTTSVVAAVMALPKGSAKPTPGRNPHIVFTMDAPDWETYAKLPEWLRTMVANSAEAQSGKVSIPGGAVGDDQRGDSRQPVLDDIPFECGDCASSTREIWRAVPSVDGILASYHGRVMSTAHIGLMPNGASRVYVGKPSFGSWDGSRYIKMSRRHSKTYKVARLVCEAFNGAPPDGRNVCMHLDESSKNNKPGNLAWGTQRENLNAPGFIKYCSSRTGAMNPHILGKLKRVHGEVM